VRWSMRRLPAFGGIERILEPDRGRRRATDDNRRPRNGRREPSGRGAAWRRGGSVARFGRGPATIQPGTRYFTAPGGLFPNAFEWPSLKRFRGRAKADDMVEPVRAALGHLRAGVMEACVRVREGFHRIASTVRIGSGPACRSRLRAIGDPSRRVPVSLDARSSGSGAGSPSLEGPGDFFRGTCGC
jgi:hypothetical protein